MSALPPAPALLWGQLELFHKYMMAHNNYCCCLSHHPPTLYLIWQAVSVVSHLFCRWKFCDAWTTSTSRTDLKLRVLWAGNLRFKVTGWSYLCPFLDFFSHFFPPCPNPAFPCLLSIQCRTQLQQQKSPLLPRKYLLLISGCFANSQKSVKETEFWMLWSWSMCDIERICMHLS